MSTVRLYNADCLDILPTLEPGSVDAVVTDPPYGLELGKANDSRQDCSHLGKRSYDNYDDTYENFISLIVPRIKAALTIADRAAVFTGPHIHEQGNPDAIGGIYHPSAIGRTSWGFKNFLPVLFYGTAPDLNQGSYPTVLYSTAVAPKNGHPCPKPLAWMEWLVKLTTREGETVFDPFVGSGTTAIACMRTRRNFIGCEIDSGYHATAERRIEAERNRHPLFAGVAE